MTCFIFVFYFRILGRFFQSLVIFSAFPLILFGLFLFICRHFWQFLSVLRFCTSSCTSIFFVDFLQLFCLFGFILRSYTIFSVFHFLDFFFISVIFHLVFFSLDFPIFVACFLRVFPRYYFFFTIFCQFFSLFLLAVFLKWFFEQNLAVLRVFFISLIR